MSTAVGIWIVIGLVMLLFVLPFFTYLVAKYAQMGKLAGTKSFLSFNRNKRIKEK